MTPEKMPLPEEAENRDRNSRDIIVSCFGDEDGFEATVFARKSQIENKTGKKVKIDKNFTRLIFEEYSDKKLLEDKIVILTSYIKGLFKDPEIKNFGMDISDEDKTRESAFDSEIHKKGAYYHEKRQGLKDDE